MKKISGNITPFFLIIKKEDYNYSYGESLFRQLPIPLSSIKHHYKIFPQKKFQENIFRTKKRTEYSFGLFNNIELQKTKFLINGAEMFFSKS